MCIRDSACIYVSDPSTADVAAWVYPTFARVGRYKIPAVKDSGFGMGVAGRGGFLFSSYSTTEDQFLIATWDIGSGCALTLVTTFDIPGNVNGMAISPNGQTLIATYGYPFPSVDSFSVATDGTPVSYTHLDVYKRQVAHRANPSLLS